MENFIRHIGKGFKFIFRCIRYVFRLTQWCFEGIVLRIGIGGVFRLFVFIIIAKMAFTRNIFRACPYYVPTDMFDVFTAMCSCNMLERSSAEGLLWMLEFLLRIATIAIIQAAPIILLIWIIWKIKKAKDKRKQG